MKQCLDGKFGGTSGREQARILLKREVRQTQPVDASRRQRCGLYTAVREKRTLKVARLHVLDVVACRRLYGLHRTSLNSGKDVGQSLSLRDCQAPDAISLVLDAVSIIMRIP